MDLEQKDDMSIVTLDTTLTKASVAELAEMFSYIERLDPHKIILDFQRVIYVNSSGLDGLFQQYSPLYSRKFDLEIQSASDDIKGLLTLANFHLISEIKACDAAE